MDSLIKETQELTDKYTQIAGHRPKIVVVQLGEDGNDGVAKAMAATFTDAGFDVEVGPLSQTPEEAAEQAEKFNADIVCISFSGTEHNELIPQLTPHGLIDVGGDNMVVIVGGAIPEEDHNLLHVCLVVEIFDPATETPKVAKHVAGILLEMFEG